MSAPRLDIDFVRTQFSGLAQGWVLFDNAGGTQVLARVVERMNDFLFHRNVQIGGSYELSQRAAAALFDGRRAMMRLVNARRPEEIVFAPSSTVALQNLSRAMAGQLSAGDEIVVTTTDHESNIGPWAGLERCGIRTKFWQPRGERLLLDLEDLGSLMTPRTRLVAVTHVSNILGTVNRIDEIARYVHERGAEICVDSVAYAPHAAIDVQTWDVDYLVFSLYKVFGPHAAVLYGRHELLAELDNLYHYFYGKDKVPAKLEPGNANYELAFGSTGIVDYLGELGRRSGSAGGERAAIEAAFAAIRAHEQRLAERLLGWLRGRPDCRILGLPSGGDPGRVPTISFTVAGHDPGELARRVDGYRIALRYGDFHARRLVEYLGLAGANGVLRVSMAHYNTPGEVDALTEALAEILGDGAAGVGVPGSGC
ncbi:MAG: cysteine desulfurase-like protein [Gammaproteobacteria bacterium]|nr:cysteine desulfurase-like protein [Gammaproteobacteria bacterium]